MKRRDFLRVASGGVAASAAVGGAEAATGGDGATRNAASNHTTTTTTPGNQTGNTTTTTGEGLPGAGTTEVVAVGPGGDFVFDPETIRIQPGATVRWEWESDFHNVIPSEIPDGATWEGTPGGASTTYDTGYTYSYTFTETGTYSYYCQPHRQQGMVGDVVVSESTTTPGGGGGEQELDPHEMGVPFQAHYVGLATIVAIIVTLVYNFFVLKYGESRHTSAPNRRD